MAGAPAAAATRPAIEASPVRSSTSHGNTIVIAELPNIDSASPARKRGNVERGLAHGHEGEALTHVKVKPGQARLAWVLLMGTDSRRIRANSVLPARRTPLTLHTADELSLVAEIALPLDSDPLATLICLHPLPTHGGMMDSHIYRKAAYRLPALARVAVLRFNTRGTWSQQGRSEGDFDHGDGERFDVAAAIEYAEFEELPAPWLLGWSFGTDLALMHGLRPARGRRRPALASAALLDLGAPGRLGRLRQAGARLGPRARRLPAARRGTRAVRGGPAGARSVAFDGSKHLWVGDAERVLDAIVAVVAPDVSDPAAHGVGRAHGDGRHLRLRPGRR